MATRPEDAGIAAAKRRVTSYYEELERLLKRHDPLDLAPQFAIKLRATRTLTDKGLDHPPHFLLHAIEANLAYHRGQNRDPIPEERYRRILQTYVGFNDPYLHHEKLSNVVDEGVG